MAPMGTARYNFSAVLKDNYIYVFGDKAYWCSSSIERCCIDDNTWEFLPPMPKRPRKGHCAVSATAGSKEYSVGGNTRSLGVFDTGSSSLTWGL
eukprot:CAMPEP_0196806094 /NCGR_PEP_ID=MMETSP1362-20130617/5949_1 /TAXON_ID=163516 /ORGANISM="Leptocylindrus danicus, Strain CCMP1856" /LENGTH=93 /DNA_ID=CAMNT_0042179397 /DNA_START=300 /DNA_END=581 /DNA_ORIENTATION=+